MLRKSRCHGFHWGVGGRTPTLGALASVLAAALLVPHAVLASHSTDAKAVRASAERGRVLLARYHCGSCHTIPGVAAARSSFAASLADYGKRSYIAGRVANDAATLQRWIVNPASVVPGTLMPAMGVSADDARAMAGYLGQLD